MIIKVFFLMPAIKALAMASLVMTLALAEMAFAGHCGVEIDVDEICSDKIRLDVEEEGQPEPETLDPRGYSERIFNVLFSEEAGALLQVRRGDTQGVLQTPLEWREGRWMVLDAQGRVLVRMVGTWAPPGGNCLVSGKLGALACRRKSGTEGAFQIHVELDEWDRGVRRILNFGHTVGHAVEAASAYALSHADGFVPYVSTIELDRLPEQP